jgi:hypothetical protein
MLGFVLGALFTMAIEFEKKPKLTLTIETPPLDRENLPAPVAHSRFLRVIVLNRPMPKIFRWLDRTPAYQCTGDITFHYPGDGASVFAKAMQVRWSGSEEPFSSQVLLNGSVAQVFDPAKYHAAFRRDCFAGSPELVDVVGKYDDDQECYGWCNDSYLHVQTWPRNPEWILPMGTYLVRLTIRCSGEKLSRVFKLDNTVAREHLRLDDASDDEAAVVKPQD